MVVKSVARHRAQKTICRRLVFPSLNRLHLCASKTARPTRPWFPPTKVILQLCSTQSRHLLQPTTLLCLPVTNILMAPSATAPSPTLLCSAATQRQPAPVVLDIHLPTNFLHRANTKLAPSPWQTLVQTPTAVSSSLSLAKMVRHSTLTTPCLVKSQRVWIKQSLHSMQHQIQILQPMVFRRQKT